MNKIMPQAPENVEAAPTDFTTAELLELLTRGIALLIERVEARSATGHA